MAEASPTKLLVTGASGLLGRAIFAEAEARGIDVVGTAFSRAGGKLIKLDLTDSDAVQAACADIRPTAIVHAAAERRPDVCEGDEAATTALNVDAVRALATAAASVGAWVLYISTDYVFDGTSPPYAPDAEPNPLNKYGVSKLQGERALREVMSDAGILRVPVLYGPTPDVKESAVTLLHAAVAGGVEKAIDDYNLRFPTFTPDVGRVICDIVAKHEGDASFAGTWHWGASVVYTKLQQCGVIADVCGLSKDHLLPNSSPSGATRPKNCQLDCSALTDVGIGCEETALMDGLRAVFAPLGYLPGEEE
eukprot:PLAT6460.22.p1 GENE.PLAT6460.22~~PLAT6460.22.p1  ORF type:complete len:330 (-),score=100.69 PLAT6460.22:30-950(-)